MIAIWLGKALSVLKAIPREVWYIAIAGVLLWAWGNHREQAGYDLRGAEQMEAEREARDLSEQSRNEATKEREADTTDIGTRKQEREDAISGIPDERPSDATIALNCQRMREAGRDVSQLPACRGR